MRLSADGVATEIDKIMNTIVSEGREPTEAEAEQIYLYGLFGDISNKELDHILKANEELNNFANIGSDLFGAYWKGSNSDPKSLKVLTRWLIKFHRLIKNNSVSTDVIDCINAKAVLSRLLYISFLSSNKFPKFAIMF